MADIIQIRRDTTTNWQTCNPVLADGEIGYNTTINQFKVGNGIDPWNSLSYVNLRGETGIQGETGAQGVTGPITDIGNLTDVNTTASSSPTGLSLLTYNSTSSEWEPSFLGLTGIGSRGVEFPHEDCGVLSNLYNFYRHVWSSGGVEGFDLTENGDGSVNISDGEALLRNANDSHAPLKAYKISGVSNLLLTNESRNYIYVDYNSGSPVIAVTTSAMGIYATDTVILYVCSRVDNEVNSVKLADYNVDYMAKSGIRSYQEQPYRHITGAGISETGSRYVTVTASRFYSLNTVLTTTAFDTSVAGTANSNVFTTVYQDSPSGWVRTANQKQINNTQYDDGSGALATLANNKFGIHWVFYVFNVPTHLLVMFGRDSYDNVSNAQAATLPTNLPPEVQSYSTGALIGKIIIQKNATSFSDIQSPFLDELKSSTPTEHNNLAGLQGGSLDSYFHLTESEHTLLTNLGINGLTGVQESTPENGDLLVYKDGQWKNEASTGVTGSSGFENIERINSDTTLDSDTQYVVADTTSNDITITFPAISSIGPKGYKIKNIGKTNRYIKVFMDSATDKIEGSETGFQWNDYLNAFEFKAEPTGIWWVF